MSAILNMLHSLEDNGLNLVILVPLFVVVVATASLLLKFSLRSPEVTKKTQNSVKKQQKLQTSNNSTQKEEKTSSVKKDKISKEKKSSSPNKLTDKQAVNDATKVNKKQQSSVEEKAPKKSAQIKKNQVNTKNNVSSIKNNQVSNKKQQSVDVFINKEEEGEWQMVTTKKQKQSKQEEKVEIATTPTKTNKKSQKSVEKSNKQPSNKIKNSKDVTEKSNNSTNFNNTEVTTPEEIQTVNSYPKETIENISLFEHETAVVDFNSSVNNINNQAAAAQEATPVANVAFDELGDDGWTDTKPQKKNRKRALRE